MYVDRNILKIFQPSYAQEQNNLTAFIEVEGKDLGAANYSHFYYKLDDAFIYCHSEREA